MIAHKLLASAVAVAAVEECRVHCWNLELLNLMVICRKHKVGCLAPRGREREREMGRVVCLMGLEEEEEETKGGREGGRGGIRGGGWVL